MSIDTECRKTFLCMCSKYGSKVNCSWSFCSIEAPYSFDCLRIHIHCFCAIAPAWCNCKCNVNAFFTEFVSTCSTFTYTSDCCISNNNFNWLAVGISQIFLEKFCSGFSHVHCLLFKRSSDIECSSTSIDCWSDTDNRIAAY